MNAIAPQHESQSGTSGVDEAFLDLFRLPPVRVKLGSTASSTENPVLDKYYGKVVFQEWADFEEEAKRTMSMVRKTVPKGNLKDATLAVRAARSQIRPTSISNEALRQIPEVYYCGTWTESPNDDGIFPRVVHNAHPIFPDETSLLGIFSNIFSAVSCLVRNMTGMNLLSVGTRYIESADAVNERKTTVQQGRGQDAGSAVQSRGTGGKTQRVLLDGTLLQLHSEDSCTGIPVCRFAIKGPEKCITARLDEPHDCFYAQQGDRTRSPYGAVVEMPCTSIPDSSKDLAQRLGSMFRTLPPTEAVPFSAVAMKSVTQALHHALSSTSGLSYVCSIASGVAIKLERGQERHRFVAKVALIRSEHIVGMTHVCLEAVKRCKIYKGLEKDLDEMRNIMESERSNELEDNSKDKDGPPSRTKREHSPNTSDDDPVMSGFQGQAEQKRQKRSSGQGMETECREEEESITDRAATTVGSPALRDASEAEVVMILNQEGISIGTGKSGSVFRGIWKGRKVAVKVRSGDSDYRIMILCDEIGTYRWLHKHHRHILGTAVPELVLFWNMRLEHTIISERIGLATEYVGKRIYSTGKYLFIEDSAGKQTRINDEDRVEIQGAALSSLTKLHDVGLLHGDIDFKNIRVEKIPNGDRHSWRAWWIDLGQSEFSTASRKTAFNELSFCANLFNLSQ